MVKSRVIILVKHFDGLPKLEDFRVVEEELRELEFGEFLVEALYFSVDPYIRRRTALLVKEGGPMIGSQVVKVIATKNDEYPVGSLMVGYWGWRTHTIVDPQKAGKGIMNQNSMQLLPDLGTLSPSLGLGAIGMPGNSAYFGFLEICQPKPGDVVVVSGAAGAVGSLVGQIAKIKGCYVIGFVGSDDKAKWLIEELGFDKVYNYKTTNWDQCLQDAASNGVDCYFDTVGGLLSTTVRNHMTDFGRIAVCGAISTYNDKTGEPTLVACCEGPFVFKQLKMEGFLVDRWQDRWMEGLTAMTKWIQEGKIQAREKCTDGFENIPKAFIEMLQGGTAGKAIIKA